MHSDTVGLHGVGMRRLRSRQGGMDHKGLHRLSLLASVRFCGQF